MPALKSKYPYGEDRQPKTMPFGRLTPLIGTISLLSCHFPVLGQSVPDNVIFFLDNRIGNVSVAAGGRFAENAVNAASALERQRITLRPGGASAPRRCSAGPEDLFGGFLPIGGPFFAVALRHKHPSGRPLVVGRLFPLVGDGRPGAPANGSRLFSGRCCVNLHG